VPVCAIGGLTPDNAAEVIAAGADMVAAVEGVFGAAEPGAAARAFARLFVE
jgi:thiamine-phosphate pyrophosphorylase